MLPVTVCNLFWVIFQINAPPSGRLIYCNFLYLESRYLHRSPQVTTQLPPRVVSYLSMFYLLTQKLLYSIFTTEYSKELAV
jgi:hypothetical protein